MELCVSPKPSTDYTDFLSHLCNLWMTLRASEIFEHLQPNLLTLLRMKLHATNIPLRYNRRIADSILSLTHNNSLINGLAVKRMHEVTERSLCHAFKQRMRHSLMNPVPTDVRHHEFTVEPPHPAFDQSQPSCRSKFLRLIKQQLHPHAHTEQ